MQTPTVQRESLGEDSHGFVTLVVDACDPDEQDFLPELVDVDSFGRIFQPELLHSCSANGIGHKGAPATPPMPLIPEHAAAGPLSMLLDGETMEVLGCTVGMLAVTGPLVCQNHFQNMVVDAGSFAGWLQTSANHAWSHGVRGLEPFDLRVKSRKLEFRMTAVLTAVGIDTCASSMGVEQVPGSEEEEHYLLCMLTFSTPRVQWRRGMKRREKGFAQSPPPDRRRRRDAAWPEEAKEQVGVPILMPKRAA